jgi:hypothetical protein
VGATNEVTGPAGLDGVLESEVIDDVCGFDLDEVRTRPGAALHMGLGEVTIDSEPGAGTRVRFAVPIELSPPRT